MERGRGEGNNIPGIERRVSHLYPSPSDILEVGQPLAQLDQHPREGLAARQLGDDGEGVRVVAQGRGATGSPGQLFD